MRLSTKPGEGLKEVAFGPKISYFLSPYISLPNNECLLFDGFITTLGGKEEVFFKKFLQNHTIRELVESSETWDGCWSIIYINSGGSVFCFTDPLGKKQLYYNKYGEIASTIAPLRRDSSLDRLYIGEIYKWGYNTDELTPFKDVKRIMPGKLYFFMSSTLQYADPEMNFDERVFFQISPKQLREVIEDRVRDYLVGTENEESIGVLLSGGLDSSVISYCLLRLRAHGQIPRTTKLNFYTINNAEDAPYVEIFAKHFGIKVKTLKYDVENVDFERALAINETPVDLGSMVPNQLMFEAIPDRFIFTGDGPDELFGGYRRIDDYDSQRSDIFHELSFYHLPRLEKAARYFHKELRCPWLSYGILKYALSLPLEQRTHKEIIKQAFTGILPQEIIDRPKLPLKNNMIRNNPMGYRAFLLSKFEDIIK